MCVSGSDSLKPFRRDLVIFLLKLQPAQLETGLGETRVEAGRLRKESDLRFHILRHQAANITLYRFNPHDRVTLFELLLRRRAAPLYPSQRVPRHVILQGGQSLQGAQIIEVGTLAEASEIQNLRSNVECAHGLPRRSS